MSGSRTRRFPSRGRVSSRCGLPPPSAYVGQTSASSSTAPALDADRDAPVLRSFFIRDGEVEEEELTAVTAPPFTEDQVGATRGTSSCPTWAAPVSGAPRCERAGDRRGRPRLADRDVPRGRRRGEARDRRLRRRRRVELQRQILHTNADVGRPKVVSAVEHLRAINPTIEVVGHEELLFSTNVFETFEPYDVIVDGTDNFPVRYLVNDATQFMGKPLVYGSIYQFEGQATVFLPGTETPCYRCCSPRRPRRARCRRAPRAACSACCPA